MSAKSSEKKFSTVRPGMASNLAGKGPEKPKSESAFPRAVSSNKTKPLPGYIYPDKTKVEASLPNLTRGLEWQGSLSIFPECNIDDSESEVDNVQFVNTLLTYQEEGALKAVNGNKSVITGFNNLAPDVLIIDEVDETSATVSAENTASLIELEKKSKIPESE